MQMQMQFFSILIISALTVAISAKKDYERTAMKKLMVRTDGLEVLKNGGEKACGWSGLPLKASSSQCGLALERIVRQPQSCAQMYMSDAARNIYLPIYLWFSTTDGDSNVQAVAQQFSLDNGVGVEVYNVMGVEVALIETNGTIGTPVSTGLSFEVSRTWALNYPTFLRSEKINEAAIAQNIWNEKGEMFTVVIYKQLNLLPVIC